MKKLILASGSPRRKQILEEAGFNVLVQAPVLEEIFPDGALEDAVMNLAKQKMTAFRLQYQNSVTPSCLVVSCDTVVVFSNKVLGKPKDLLESKEFLQQLSGRVHSVISGVCIFDGAVGQDFCFYDLSKVWFKNLSEVDIIDYVNSKQGLDKAGAYGIQEVGEKFVEKIEGSYLNIVGFPLEKFLAFCEQRSWQIARA